MDTSEAEETRFDHKGATFPRRRGRNIKCIKKRERKTFRRGVSVSHRHIRLPFWVHTTDESTVLCLGLWSIHSPPHPHTSSMQVSSLERGTKMSRRSASPPVSRWPYWESKVLTWPNNMLLSGGVISSGQSTASGHAAVEANSHPYLSLARHAKSAASHVTHTHAHLILKPENQQSV